MDEVERAMQYKRHLEITLGMIPGGSTQSWDESYLRDAFLAGYRVGCTDGAAAASTKTSERTEESLS